MKNYNDTIGNRTRDFPACSAVSQPTALLRAPYFKSIGYKSKVSHSANVCKFLIIKERDALISQIYFWNKTLHNSDSFFVHHQESSAVHTAIGISYSLC